MSHKGAPSGSCNSRGATYLTSVLSAQEHLWATARQLVEVLRHILQQTKICPLRLGMQAHKDALSSAGTPTSKTGTLKAASSLCRVGAAREEEQLRMNLSGGGLSLG